MIDSLLNTFDTGNGFWNPVIWIVSFFVIFLIIYILRGIGNKDNKENSEQTKVLPSGKPGYKKDKLPASNLYWGWMESMKWFIDSLKRMHNGDLGDYVLWFVIVMGILFLLAGLM
jgi:Na+/H+ antiporter NhaC